MFAVEFETRVTNGSILIPEQWKDKLSGEVRVIVLTAEDPVESEVRLEQDSVQSSIRQAASVWHDADSNQAEISAVADAVFAKMGISGAPVGTQKLREMMLADGINPEDNEFSRGIIEMREEEA